MHSAPTVSVVIPTHNRADLLPEAINSVLAQSHLNLEVIVVDDGSIDTTAQVMLTYQADKRVIYRYQPNQGRAMARNYGALIARGEYLGFLDSDDLYSPNSIEAHLAVFRQHPDIGMTIGGYAYLPGAGPVIRDRCPWEESNGDLDLKSWLFNCLAMPGSVLILKSWFERIGGFDPACEIAEDWDLFLRLSCDGCGMAWVKQPVCQYRIHGGNSIQNLSQHRTGSLQAIEKLFQSGALPAGLEGNEDQAKAGIHLNFARRALALGQFEVGLSDLLAAVQQDPALMSQCQIEFWENLLTPPPDYNAPLPVPVHALISALKEKHLPVRAALVNKALARVEMRQFFLAQKCGTPEQAARHLYAGLRWDIGWLANRGVITFLVRQLINLR